MSHQEKIQRINAELNTTETWSKRWQVEREHNERLCKAASLVREGIQQLRAATSQAYTKHGSLAAAARAAEDERALRNHERMLIIQSARAAALDDVLELLDQVDRAD
jgi:hypothetical protein